MRLFVYEECQDVVNDLGRKCGVTPTKYLNTLLKVLQEDCHTELTEELNERIKEFNRGSKRPHKG